MQMKNLQYGTIWINSGEQVASPASSFECDDKLKETSRHNSLSTPRDTSHATPGDYSRDTSHDNPRETSRGT